MAPQIGSGLQTFVSRLQSVEYASFFFDFKTHVGPTSGFYTSAGTSRHSTRVMVNMIEEFTAEEMFEWLSNGADVVIVDVRSEELYDLFQVEGPEPIPQLNISYIDFLEIEEECVERLPRDKPIRVICSKVGASQMVAVLLLDNGFEDLGFLDGGIAAWLRLQIPRLVFGEDGMELWQFIRPAFKTCSHALIADGEMVLINPVRCIQFYEEFATEKGVECIAAVETGLRKAWLSGMPSLHQKGVQVFAPETEFKESALKFSPLQDGESMAKEGVLSNLVATSSKDGTSLLAFGRFLIGASSEAKHGESLLPYRFDSWDWISGQQAITDIDDKGMSASEDNKDDANAVREQLNLGNMEMESRSQDLLELSVIVGEGPSFD